MANINSFNFGFIVVDGKQYVYDVIILPDSTVKEREATKARLGSHNITWDDVARIVKEQPEGYYLHLVVSPLLPISNLTHSSHR